MQASLLILINMNYISNLPCELIDLIAENNSLDDVTNLGLTCKALQAKILQRDTFMWRRFSERWPALNVIRGRKWRNMKINIKIQLMKGIKIERQPSVSRCAKTVLPRSEREIFLKLVKPMGYIDLIYGIGKKRDSLRLEDDLMTILADNRDKYDRLTETYYAGQFLYCLKHSRLEKEWHEFMKLPDEQKVLERVATIVSQWCQPEKRLFYSDISTMLYDITQEVLIYLKEDYPSHSIFSASPEQFSFWEKNNINCDEWDATEAKQIINVMQRFVHKTFTYNRFDTEYILIDKVLEDKRGNYVFLLLIFSCVARRLGVCCDLIQSPKRVLFLCWKKNSDIANHEYADYYRVKYIRNRQMFNICVECLEKLSNPVETNKVDAGMLLLCMRELSDFSDTIMYLLRYFIYITNRKMSSFMLSDYTTGNNPVRYKDVTNYWFLLKKNATSIINSKGIIFNLMVKQLMEQLQWQNCVNPKKRTYNIKYAIGLCVKTKHGTPGVIVGWDEKFDKKYSRLVTRGICVNRDDTDEMTFYKILSCENKMYYINGDLIEPRKLDTHITHSEIGRYFERFMKTHYEPNRFLEESYPEDKVVRERYAAILNDQS